MVRCWNSPAPQTSTEIPAMLPPPTPTLTRTDWVPRPAITDASASFLCWSAGLSKDGSIVGISNGGIVFA